PCTRPTVCKPGGPPPANRQAVDEQRRRAAVGDRDRLRRAGGADGLCGEGQRCRRERDRRRGRWDTAPAAATTTTTATVIGQGGRGGGGPSQGCPPRQQNANKPGTAGPLGS